MPLHCLQLIDDKKSFQVHKPANVSYLLCNKKRLVALSVHKSTDYVGVTFLCDVFKLRDKHNE